MGVDAEEGNSVGTVLYGNNIIILQENRWLTPNSIWNITLKKQLHRHKIVNLKFSVDQEGEESIASRRAAREVFDVMKRPLILDAVEKQHGVKSYAFRKMYFVHFKSQEMSRKFNNL